MLALQIFISFLVGGLFIALQTLITERVPPHWRGIVLTIPTTFAISLFFIGLIKTPQDVAEAVIITPAAIGVAYMFTLIFATLISYKLPITLIGSFVSWGLMAAFLLKFPPATFQISIGYGAIGVIISYLLIRNLPSVNKLKKYPINAKHLIIRSLIGGIIIALAVTLAKTLNNYWGGLFTVFPATYTSTFIIYYFMQGSKAIPGIAKSLFFPGSIGFILYGWIAAITFPLYGIWLGTLFSYIAVMIFFCIWESASNLIAKK